MRTVSLALLVAAACAPPAPASPPDDTDSKREPADAGAGDPAPAPPAAPTPASFSDEEARSVCETLIAKTRACKDLYLPALLRTRAKYDQPAGIAARYQAEGEAKLLPIASEVFDEDFSQKGIAARCDAMMAKPKAVRDWIVGRERSCLPVADQCPEFVACNVLLLEKKWGPEADAPPTE